MRSEPVLIEIPRSAYWMRLLHLYAVHPLCSVLRAAGLRRLSFRLHDATMFPYRCWIWDHD